MIPISSLKALKLNKNQKEYRSLSVHYNITISHNQLPVLSKKPVSRNVQAAYELLLSFPLHIFRLSHFPLIVPEEKPRAERWYANTSGPERAARKHQPQHDLSAPQEVHLQKWILTSLLPIWIRRSFLWIIHVYHRTTKRSRLKSSGSLRTRSCALHVRTHGRWSFRRRGYVWSEGSVTYRRFDCESFKEAWPRDFHTVIK